MKSAAVYALALLVGCSPAPEDDSSRAFQLDEAFSPEEQALVREYLAKLSAVTGKPISVSVGVSRSHKVILRVVGMRGASWQGGSRVIRIGTVLATPEHTAHFAAHEMGHDLGFDHVEGESLMAGLLSSDGWVWSEYDQRECERVGVCTVDAGRR